MTGNDIKIELVLLGKKQVDLLDELRKRGFPRLGRTQLSPYLSGRDLGPQSNAVLAISEQIINEWKKEAAGRRSVS